MQGPRFSHLANVAYLLTLPPTSNVSTTSLDSLTIVVKPTFIALVTVKASDR
jgi:hypothetical protein